MKKHRVSDESINCAVGLINGLLLSLPIWGLIYFFLRLLLLN